MPTFFSIGFRPFFASGTLFATIALVAWGLFWHTGSSTFSPFGGMLFWHPHELLMGFSQAIIIGFLLTATRNWTGLETATPMLLCLLFLCWWSARAVMAFGAHLPITIIVLSQLLTPLIAALCIGLPILRKRMWRNLFAPILLLLMATIDAVMLWTINATQQLPSSLFHASILIIVLLMSVIGGRVIPLFTANRLNTPKPNESKLTLLLAILPLIVLIIWSLISDSFESSALTQGIAALLAVVHSKRLLSWHTPAIWRHPMLWSLFLFYGAMPLGFALLALNAFEALGSIPWHMLTIGAMMGLIISMVSRVSLGHTGRNIVHDHIISISFYSIAASAILRTAGVYLFMLHPYLILISALLAAAGTALIFVRFIYIWLTPRPD